MKRSHEWYDPYTVMAFDPAYRYSSIALLVVDPIRISITIKHIHDIDNRKLSPHGLVYQRVYDAVYEQAQQADVFVREYGGYSGKWSKRVMVEVNGVAEMALWNARKNRFFDISPTRVKQLITGDQHATKGKVANALPQYVGPRKYITQDQSDAVAIGLALLKLHGLIDLSMVRRLRKENESPDGMVLPSYGQRRVYGTQV